MVKNGRMSHKSTDTDVLVSMYISMCIYIYISSSQYPISYLHQPHLHFPQQKLSPALAWDGEQERQGQAEEAPGAAASAEHRLQGDQGCHEAPGPEDVARLVVLNKKGRLWWLVGWCGDEFFFSGAKNWMVKIWFRICLESRNDGWNLNPMTWETSKYARVSCGWTRRIAGRMMW